MGKKTGIKTKVSSYGRSLSLIMTADRFAALASHLPEDSEERTVIDAMVSQAKETKALDELKAKLNQPLSRETLTRCGWSMLEEEVEKKHRVTAGVRGGAFRFDVFGEQSGWVFGPRGAFDREDEKTLILPSAWQAGVFCEKHSAWMLGEPRQTQAEAEQEARDMLASWKKEVPATLVHLNLNPDETHPGLPKGAIQRRGCVSNAGRMPIYAVRYGSDQPLHHISDRRVDAFRFDARLGANQYDVLKDLEWKLAQRDYDPRWDSHRYILDGPLDCVLGSIWGTVSNTCPGSLEYGTQEIYPLPDEKTAIAAAEVIAVGNGYIEGEKLPYPETIPVPDHATGATTDNPFA